MAITPDNSYDQPLFFDWSGVLSLANHQTLPLLAPMFSGFSSVPPESAQTVDAVANQTIGTAPTAAKRQKVDDNEPFITGETIRALSTSLLGKIKQSPSLITKEEVCSFFAALLSKRYQMALNGKLDKQTSVKYNELLIKEYRADQIADELRKKCAWILIDGQVCDALQNILGPKWYGTHNFDWYSSSLSGESFIIDKKILSKSLTLSLNFDKIKLPQEKQDRWKERHKAASEEIKRYVPDEQERARLLSRFLLELHKPSLDLKDFGHFNTFLFAVYFECTYILMEFDKVIGEAMDGYLDAKFEEVFTIYEMAERLQLKLANAPKLTNGIIRKAYQRINEDHSLVQTPDNPYYKVFTKWGGKLTNGIKLPAVGDDQLAAMLQLFSNVSAITIENNPHITGTFVSVLKKMTKLSLVVMANCPNVKPENLVSLDKCPSLKLLSLQNLQLSDELLLHLASHEKLEKINISRSTGFTLTGLEYLQYNPFLSVKMLHCPTVISDAGVIHPKLFTTGFFKFIFGCLPTKEEAYLAIQKAGFVKQFLLDHTVSQHHQAIQKTVIPFAEEEKADFEKLKKYLGLGPKTP